MPARARSAAHRYFRGMWRNSPALATPSGSGHRAGGESRERGEHEKPGDENYDGDHEHSAKGAAPSGALGPGVRNTRCRILARNHGYLYTTHVAVEKP